MIAVKHLHVTHFDRMPCAFQVQYSEDSNTHLIPLSSLYCHGTLALQNKRGKMYIIEKTTSKKICGHFCDYIYIYIYIYMDNIVVTYMYSLLNL